MTRLLRPETTDVAHFRFVASARQTPDRQWELTLDAYSARGDWSRQVRGTGCTELQDAAAVMIALAIEPSGGAEGSDPPSEQATAGASSVAPPGETQAPASRPRSPSNQPPTPPTRPRATGVAEGGGTGTATSTVTPTLAIGSRGGLALGVLPKPTPALWLDGVRTWGPWQLDGGAGWIFPQTGSVEDDASKGAEIGLAVGAAGLGFAPAPQPVRLGLHAGVQGGIMYGRSIGLEDPELRFGPWVAATAGISACYLARRPLSVIATAEAWFSIWQTAFLFGEGHRELHRPARPAGMGSVGLLWWID